MATTLVRVQPFQEATVSHRSEAAANSRWLQRLSAFSRNILYRGVLQLSGRWRKREAFLWPGLPAIVAMLIALALLCLNDVHVVNAQEQNPSILELLTSQGDIDVGHPVIDSLTEANHLLQSGHRVEAWTLNVLEDRSYLIDLRSDVLDTYLYIVRKGVSDAVPEDYVLTNDDGGSGLNARICFEAPSSGPFLLVASALHAAAGPYELNTKDGCDADAERSEALPEHPSLTPPPSFDPWQPDEVDSVRYGVVHSGTLTSTSSTDENGRPVDVWSLLATQGKRLAIDLVSEDFDALLHLYSADWGPLTNDDGGFRGLDSRLCFVVRQTTEFRVVVSSVESRARGSYGLLATIDRDGILCDRNRIWSDPMYFADAVGSEAFEGAMSLHLGDTIDGTFTSDDEPLTMDEWRDPVFRDRWHYWAIEGAAGESVLFELRSFDFDPTLWIVGPGLSEGMRRDEGDTDCNSVIPIAFPAAGTYRVLASSRTEGEGVGRYQLVVHDPNDSAFANVSCEGLLPIQVDRELHLGYEFDGVLTAADPVIGGQRMQAWSLPIVGHDVIAITVESQDFDPQVRVFDSDGGRVRTEDDDRAWLRNFFRATLAARSGGRYRVVIVSQRPNGMGRFVVRALRTVAPEGDVGMLEGDRRSGGSAR